MWYCLTLLQRFLQTCINAVCKIAYFNKSVFLHIMCLYCEVISQFSRHFFRERFNVIINQASNKINQKSIVSVLVQIYENKLKITVISGRLHILFLEHFIYAIESVQCALTMPDQCGFKTNSSHVNTRIREHGALVNYMSSYVSRNMEGLSTTS